MNKKISFLFTTKRDFNQFFNRVVNTIHRSIKYDNYEIVVCSPNKLETTDDKIIYVEDTIQKGGLPGINQAYRKSTGDLIIACSDDLDFVSIDIQNVFNEFKFENQLEIGTMKTTSPGFIGIPNFDNQGNYSSSSSIWMLRWPIIPKYIIDTYLDGYIFHPSFRLVWGDNWLSYFVSKHNFRMFECNIILRPFGITYDEPEHIELGKIDGDTIKTLIINYKNENPYSYTPIQLQRYA
jgi:hypothetical protein